MKISLDLSSARCEKPGCTHWRGNRVHRHHIRHKKRFINLFQSRKLHPGIRFAGELEWSQFVRRLTERYHEFRERDIVRLCEWHHAEIHGHYTHIYHREISPNKAISIRDAVRVMRACKKACRDWLSIETPGISPRRSGWRRSS